MKNNWTNEEIMSWIKSQTGDSAFYQTIELKDNIKILGKVDTLQRIQQMDLPSDLSGLSVLDVGCNSGSLCFETKKRGASEVVGIDVMDVRLNQAKTIAEILDLDIDFKKMDLFTAKDLGQFNIVFCIAVLTEVSDLIRGLEILKNLTKDTLYLEIALSDMPCEKILLNFLFLIRKVTNFFLLGNHSCKINENLGIAQLRRINSKTMKGWSLVPNRGFIDTIMADSFHITNLGQSQRYTLLKLVRKYN